MFYPFMAQARISMTTKGKLLKSNVGKGENAGEQHFLLFQQCFLAEHRETANF